MSRLWTRGWLPRSFTAQLLGYTVLLLLAMGLVAATLSLQAARPSAEQMARMMTVVAQAAQQALLLQPRNDPRLADELTEAGVFPVLPARSQPQRTLLPFPNALREILERRLQRPVQLIALPDGETALWLPSNEPAQLPFGIRYEPARGPVAQSGMRVVLATAVALLLSAWWLARWLSRPLRRLSQALPGLAAGAALPKLGRSAPEEIQALASALGDAMGRLRAQTQAREQTLAGISHDLRTPLMRISVAAQMLPEHPHVAQIQADVAEMDQLIGSALELARAGHGEPDEVVAIAKLARSLVGDQPDRWLLRIDPGLSLRAPPIALRRALNNLIQNAERHAKAPFAIRSEPTAQGLRLIVADAGEGLLEISDHSARQPFLQGPRNVHGSGLGLAIVDRLADSFESELSLEQVPGGFQAVLVVPAHRVIIDARPT